MNLKLTIAMCTVGMAFASCSTGSTELKSGIDIANMDTTVSAGTDFYQYANGGWCAANPLTDEYSRFGTMDKMANQNREKIKTLVDEIASTTHEVGTNAQKIGDLYNLAMDSVRLNKEGFQPVLKNMLMINGLKDKESIYTMLADLRKIGVGAFFSLYVGADEQNSSMNIVNLNQGGLSMNDRDYYLKDDENSVRIREAFKVYVKDLAKLVGVEDAAADKTRDLVMNVETKLAEKSRSRIELRDVEANYNKMTIDELKKLTPSFNWDEFFKAAGLNDVKEVVVGQPEALQTATEVIKGLSTEDMITYLQWKLINDATGFLSDDFQKLSFDFYSGTMRGIKQQKPRWKRAVAMLDGALGEAVGQLYTEKYFPASSKQRMVELVKNLQIALGERIAALPWMSDATKAKAQEKLATFTVKVGYPDKWKDYSALTIDNKDSYYENAVRCSEWAYNDMISKNGQPVDKGEWFMTPQTVNAYYNPTTNEICFPAGILQYPCFDPTADDAFNYGAIGVVIGHEMTHGFDDQGRLYDKEGNMKDWWTEDDSKKFNERAEVMVAVFDSLEVLPGIHARGKQTLGENIADHGGLKVAYQAFKNATKNAPLPVKDGFTADQRFFLAYAGVWAGNIRKEEIMNLTNMDVHSLARWRVNAALPQIDAWYEAFGITEKDPMYVAPEKRANVW